MKFIEIEIDAGPEVTEILIAELSMCGADSFDESGPVLKAYFPITEFDEETIQETLMRYNAVILDSRTIGEENWNQVWESNFTPVSVNGRCIIRASFHPVQPEFEYEIVINPKMSFGTGHHQTTHMMIQWLLDHSPKDKLVLDAGCGTGVLSILTVLMGAREVRAVDIDDWAYHNSKENFELNRIDKIELYQGTVNDLPKDKNYDVILANIEKNVLLNEMNEYRSRLKKGGRVVMSGFFSEDIQEIAECAGTAGLILEDTLERDLWACCSFVAH